MRIIVVGCGKVGQSIVRSLSREGHDIAVIDVDPAVSEDVSGQFDVLGVVGNGASYSVLQEAGVEDADLLIAVTDSDEQNLLCCLFARKVGNCSTIARVRNPVYNQEIGYIKEELGLSMTVNPECAAAEEIARILRFPSAIKIETFAGGRAELLQFVIPKESLLNGAALNELPERLGSRILVGAVERGDEAFIPGGDFILQEGDTISIVSAPKDAKKFFARLGVDIHRVNDTMIVGGGKIAFYLTRLLQNSGIRVKIVENDRKRCEELAEALPGALILCADGADQEVLREEGIESCESFVSLTGIDEQNIFMSLFARQVNPKAKVVTKSNRINMDLILSKMGLDSLIHPKDITSERIVSYVRAMQNSIGSNVETLYNVIEDKVEALEFLIREKSPVVGIPLSELAIRKDVLVASIIRHGKILMPSGATTIEVGDSVVIFTTGRGIGNIKDILEVS